MPQSHDYMNVKSCLTFRDKHQDGVKQAEEEELFEADAKINVKVDPKTILNDDAIKQSATLFLVAGFDTTANTLSLVMYHLATNLEVQEQARQIVDVVIAEYDDGEEKVLDYDKLSSLEYLDMVISESMRMSPVAVAIERTCTKDYVTSTGIHIRKGHRVQIPTAGVQLDPAYWENPEKFDPERFNKENKKRNNPYAFMPFGVGPRNCIGMRFAILEVKVALFHVLKEFEILPSEKTPIPVQYDKTKLMTTITNGNFLRLVPRKY